ncbi:NTF2-related export protein [Planococcus citri]|uniref:NTF2-related export protein n=1 Tax=Planococcus citri TaxID=170843 RepID=UPI0031F93364
MFQDRKDLLQMQSSKLESSNELDAAEQFVKIYYEKLDKQQHQSIARLYLPEALFVWNGISNVGPDKIQQFLTQLPPCTHTIYSFDMQRIHDNNNPVPNQKTYVIKTGGQVRFKDHPPKQFFQTFFTVSDREKYRISIDNYRCLGGTP